MLTRQTSQFLLLTGVIWAGLLAAFVLQSTFGKILFGLPVVLVLPGMLALRLVGLRQAPLERWTLVVMASIGVLMVSVLLAASDPDGISPTSTLTFVAGSTVALGVGWVIASLIRERTSMGAGRASSRHGPPRSQPMRLIGPRVAMWAVTGLVVAAVAGVSGWLSVSSERAISEPDFTQLTMVPADTPGTYLLGVNNLEEGDARYQLEISQPNGETKSEVIEVRSHETFRRNIEADAPGELVVRLYGGSSTYSGYRQVKAVAS